VAVQYDVGAILGMPHNDGYKDSEVHDAFHHIIKLLSFILLEFVIGEGIKDLYIQVSNSSNIYYRLLSFVSKSSMITLFSRVAIVTSNLFGFGTPQMREE
jgi:hypothetical protein